MKIMKMMAALLIVLVPVWVGAQQYNMFEPNNWRGDWITKSGDRLTFANTDGKYLWMNLAETKRGNFKFDGKTFEMRLYVGQTLQGYVAETVMYGDCTFSSNGGVFTITGRGRFAGKRWVFKRMQLGK